MRRIKGVSLLEAVVAAVIFLLIFAIAMELMTRLTIREDDTMLTVEADRHVMQAMQKYATGEWPCAKYDEQYDWGEVHISILPYRDFNDMQSIEVTARIDGSFRRIRLKQLAVCSE